ncbi:MAG: hypothetical protein HY662_01465 [Chloroflexi bacterium]|nr:hypothetical protein [Chloroflexota bacterium]
MAFSDEVIKQAWDRSGGQCECQKRSHTHFYVPCGKPLVWENRGKVVRGGWDARHINPERGDVLANCEIICSSCVGTKSFSIPI